MEDKKFTFKSKYRDDVLNLEKGKITSRPDGSRMTEGRLDAQFSFNTFTTYDPEIAQKIRDVIASRKREGRDIGIFETSDLPNDPSGTGPTVRKGVKSAKE